MYEHTPDPSTRLTAPRASLAPWQIRAVTAYIEENLHATLQNTDLASVVRLSPFHFGRAFRCSLGRTPHAFVVGRRLHQAEVLMLTSDATLSEIAATCGFADQAHFSRLFRQFAGDSPGAWRKARTRPSCKPASLANPYLGGSTNPPSIEGDSAMVPPNSGVQISVAVTHAAVYLAAGIAALLRASKDFVVDVEPHRVQPADVVVTDYAAGVYKPPVETYLPGGKISRRVVVTARDTAWQIRRAIDAGVRGYLLHDCTSAELADAVRCVADGGTYLPVQVAQQLAESLTYEVLTARELAVLELMGRGLSNKGIGQRLDIGEGTVKSHVKPIFDKLCVTSRTAAIAEARRRGMLSDA
jgi:DNA-binding NarL/FixJ family response regulator/AraC-like DNA-binding protein